MNQNFFHDFDDRTNAFTEWYNFQQDLITAVSSGDINILDEFLSNPHPYLDIQALLPASASKDFAYNQYYFVIILTIISHVGITNGVPAGEAIMSSNKYLEKCHLATNIKELTSIYSEMLIYFTKLIHNIHIPTNRSHLVKMVDSYIQQHMAEKITVGTIADYLNLSRNTLSNNFKKDTGYNISYYISLQKIERAKYIIASTNYSIADISNYLAFSSQSHLQKTFKEIVGITPLEYRKKSTN